MRSSSPSKRNVHPDYNGNRMMPPQAMGEDPVSIMLSMQAQLNAMAGELHRLKSGSRQQAVMSPSGRMRRQHMHDYDIGTPEGEPMEAVSEFNTSQQENWDNDANVAHESDIIDKEGADAEEEDDFVPQFGGTPKKKPEPEVRQRVHNSSAHPSQQQYH